jgi:Ca-activated chloride channel homolog
MNFLAPAAFLFAAAIPVVVVFYLLKRKRVVKLVSSTLLWQKYLAETQASKPFQRLRHNWLLLIQILLLLLVVLALARPYFSGHQQGGQRRVIILDASASMQSTDEKPSRFEKARGEALKFVNTLLDNDETVVLQAAASTEVKQSATSDKAVLRRAIEGCAASDSPTRLGEAFKLAETLIRDRTGAEIHLFSDGAIPNMPEFEDKNLPLIFHRQGQRANNLGIISLDVRANPENPNQRAIFTTVANYSTNTMKTEVELLFDKEPIDLHPLDLGPTNTQPLVFTAPQSKDGIFTVRLTSKDDLAADDQASIVSLLPQAVKVLLVSRGNWRLEKALRAPNTILTVAPMLMDAGKAYDVVVLDDVIPTVWPAVNTMAIHTVNTNWFPTWSTVSMPTIVDWKNAHPLLRSVNFDNVGINESFAVKTPSWGISILDSQQTPLIIAGEKDGHRLLWIAFDPLQSSWPLRFTFPIFVVNAVEWLDPSGVNMSQFMVRAGDAFRFRMGQDVTKPQLTRPDGSTAPLSIETNGRDIIFADTTKQGVYRLQAGTNTVSFCVNLLDAAESNIKPREELPFGKYAKVGASKLRRANKELWRWIALAGLGVLLFEWWYYHKRTA